MLFIAIDEYINVVLMIDSRYKLLASILNWGYYLLRNSLHYHYSKFKRVFIILYSLFFTAAISIELVIPIIGTILLSNQIARIYKRHLEYAYELYD